MAAERAAYDPAPSPGLSRVGRASTTPVRAKVLYVLILRFTLVGAIGEVIDHGVAAAGHIPLVARATAAAIACASGLTAMPSTSTVGVALTPAATARAVT